MWRRTITTVTMRHIKTNCRYWLALAVVKTSPNHSNIYTMHLTQTGCHFMTRRHVDASTIRIEQIANAHQWTKHAYFSTNHNQVWFTSVFGYVHNYCLYANVLHSLAHNINNQNPFKKNINTNNQPRRQWVPLKIHNKQMPLVCDSMTCSRKKNQTLSSQWTNSLMPFQ